jgi:hypothetical protein
MNTDTRLKDSLRAGHSAIAPAPTRATRIKALQKTYRITCNCLDKARDATLDILERAAQAAPPAPPLSSALVRKGA